VHSEIQEQNHIRHTSGLATNFSNMAYTSVGLAIRIVSLYLCLLTLTSIYQAISPTSPHNQGDIVDHGAEFLQHSFTDLRTHYPRFDYLVQTLNRVMLQVLLWVAMRYNVNTAMYTGIGIGFDLVTVVFVAGWLVVWLVRVVGELVYGLVFGVMFRVVWGPMSLVVGLIQWLGKVIEFVLGFIGFVSSYVEMIWGFVGSLFGNDTGTHGSSRGHHTPEADDCPPKEEDTGPGTDEQEHAIETDHIDWPDERHRVPEIKEPAPTEPAPTKPAPTESLEIESDQDSRHRMKRTQTDLQDSHDTTDSDGKENLDEVELVTSKAVKEILREKRRLDRERRKFESEFEACRASDYYVPKEEWNSDGIRVTHGEQLKVSENKHLPSLKRGTSAPAPTSSSARGSPRSFPRSWTHKHMPPTPPTPPTPPMPPRPSSETRRPSRSSKQIPPRPSSHTGNPPRASVPRANGTRTTITIGGDIQVTRDGEAYMISSTSGESVRATVNGKPVKLERDGQTFKLPKDGGPLRISLDGGIFAQIGKPPRNDEQTKLGKNAPTPPALSETDGEKIRPENNDGET
jgi:hypothetical protein